VTGDAVALQKGIHITIKLKFLGESRHNNGESDKESGKHPQTYAPKVLERSY
jgi:hypothetical protein